MSGDTEKSKLEGKIHELELVMNSVFENSSEYIMTVNKELRVMFNNRPIPGVSALGSVNMNACEYLPRQYRDQINETLQTVFDTGKEKVFVMENGYGDGKREYTVNVSPIEDGPDIVAILVLIKETTHINKILIENNRLQEEIAKNPNAKDVTNIIKDDEYQKITLNIEKLERLLDVEKQRYERLIEENEKLSKSKSNGENPLPSDGSSDVELSKMLEENEEFKEKVQDLMKKMKGKNKESEDSGQKTGWTSWIP